MRRLGRHTAGTESAPGTLYRGMTVQFYGWFWEELEERHARGATNDWAFVVDYIRKQGFAFSDYGFGSHWTRSFEVAKNYAHGSPGAGLPVVLRAEWNGQGLDTRPAFGDGVTDSWAHEQEVTLLEDAPLTLTGIWWKVGLEEIPMPGPFTTTASLRTASAGKLYRGVRVDLDPALLAKLGDAVDVEDVGRELEVGPAILDQLAAYGGLGTHWSTRPEIAERFALNSSAGTGWGVGVLITAEWNGQGEDPDKTGVGGVGDNPWADEAEVTLLPGTPLTIVSVVIGSSFRDGVEVLHTTKYQGHAQAFAEYGLPVPVGGPQTRTAKRLYHRTTPEAAEAIYSSGRMLSKEYDGSVFFSTEQDGQGEGYGDAVVVLDVPEDRLDEIGWMDDEFPDGEEHWALDSTRIDPSWFVRTAARTASTDLVARGIGYVKIPTRDLCRKFVDGTVTAQEIVDMVLQENNGRAGVWWGSIGDNEWDYYDYEDAVFHHAYYSSNAYPELILEECEEADAEGGFGDEYYRNNPADVGVVLWAEHPYVNGTFWNPLTDNKPLPGHESQSYVPEGTQLRLVKVGWVDAVNDETILPANGMTVTAALGGQGITVTANRTAAAPQILYRGANLTMMPDYDDVYEQAVRGDTAGALQRTLDYMRSNNLDSALGIGRHWSTDKKVAKDFSKGPFGLNVLMSGMWDGNGEDLERTNTYGDWDDEDEITLLPGTPVQLTSLTINHRYMGSPGPIELLNSGGITVTAAGKCEYCTEQATQRIIHSEGMAYIPVCDSHLSEGKDDAAACVPYGDPDPSNIVRVDKIEKEATRYFTEDELRAVARDGVKAHPALASDFDDILDLLGPSVGPGDPYVAPENTHPGIDGVPRGWERYVEDMLAAPDRTSSADLWMPTSAVAHYAEYIRDGEQLEAVMYAIRQRGGIWSPVDISTDGTLALLHEGNHRLAAAQRLGIAEIPVRVSVDPVVRANEGTPVPLEPVLEGWLRQQGKIARIAASPRTLYRGIRVTYDRTPFADQLREIAATGQGQLGEEVVDYLASASPHASIDGVSLGRHWSTDYNVATGIASVLAKDGEKGGIVLTAQWNGVGVDEAQSYVGGDYPEESEVTLLPGTEVTIVKAELITGYGTPPIVLWSGSSTRKAHRVSAVPGGVLPYTPSPYESALHWLHERGILEAGSGLRGAVRSERPGSRTVSRSDHDREAQSPDSGTNAVAERGEGRRVSRREPLEGQPASGQEGIGARPGGVRGTTARGHGGEALAGPRSDEQPTGEPPLGDPVREHARQASARHRSRGEQDALHDGAQAGDAQPVRSPVAREGAQEVPRVRSGSSGDLVREAAQGDAPGDQRSEVRRDHAIGVVAAVPGGVLPYSPSPYGYVWEEHDGEAVAVTRDGIAEMVLSTLPGGQIGWAVYDDEGLVERGNFSGMYTEEPQGIYYRADRLLSEFDSNPVIPAKTPGYSEDYTETFPSNFPAPNFMQP